MKSSHSTRRRFDLAQGNRASSEIARDINRDIVLELLRVHQPIARADLARLSGLQRSTVSLIIEQLIAEKWVVEGAILETARGRRPTMLSLNPDLLMLVADIRPRQATLGVVDLHGRFLSREIVPLINDPEASLNRIADAMLALRAQNRKKNFEGIGISLPGRVDPNTQRLIFAPNLKWTAFDIKAVIEKRLHLQVQLDNAANACLLSALWFGPMRSARNLAVVTISSGVGVAALSDGQLVTGRNGLAGEFGHIPIDLTGPLCGCGQHGCWEMFASSRAALRYHTALKPRHPATAIVDLIHRADEGEPEALEALAQQARSIGRGLQMVIAAFSPDAILFAGDITAGWARVGPIIQAEVESRLLAGTAPALMPIRDGESARLRGAAALVLQRHARYHRSTLPNRPFPVDSEDSAARDAPLRTA